MVSTRLSRHCGSARLPLGCPAHTLLPVGPKEPSPIVVLCTGRSSRLASSDVQEFSLQSLVSVRRNKPGGNEDGQSGQEVIGRCEAFRARAWHPWHPWHAASRACAR